jgi:hypothetical protein
MCKLCNGSGFVAGQPVIDNYGEPVNYETVKPCDCMVQRIIKSNMNVTQAKPQWWDKRKPRSEEIGGGD